MSVASAPTLEDTRLELNRFGVYEIRWTERSRGSGRARTRTYSCRTPDRSLAEHIRKDWVAAHSAAAQRVNANTLAELVDLYEENYIKPNNLGDSQKWSLKPILRLMGNETLETLTATRFTLYRNTRTAEGVVPGTIRRELGAMLAVLNWAARKRFLPEGSILPDVDLPPASQGRINYLPKAEEARVFNLAANDEDASGKLTRVGRFICIGLAAAARKEAIETLTWDRVDFAAGLIDFREVGRQVSNKRRVPVPISDRLRPVLERAFQERGHSTYVLDVSGSIRTAYRTFCKKHGVGVTAHALRRTWATLAAQRGVSMFDIAGVLGDSVETVTKHYAVYSPNGLRHAVNG